MIVISTIVSTITALFSITTFLVNLQLLFCLYISKTIKREPTLVLFYVRFAVDSLIGVLNLAMTFFTLIQNFNLPVDLDSHQSIVFNIIWTSTNVMGIRDLLSIVINLDRVLSVLIPIVYRNSRKNCSNFILTIIVFCYPVLTHLVLLKVCDFKFNFPPGCIYAKCFFNKCYNDYGIEFAIITQSLSALFSLTIAVKLYLLNKFKAWSRNKDLTRANYLALLDTVVVVIFDVIPSTIINYFPPPSEFGSVYFFFRMGGYSVEAYLGQRSLKRRKVNSWNMTKKLRWVNNFIDYKK